ncbi:MAG: hypothetical protein A3C36_03755 [Omnitrophica WOR_2 bacterium RIFCSPHIGHO2_02_FULL_52_10]|nr:MAG: hypothetical protein A3C36_03755 [Omnitrophica WOR_2 bacterium RIFCSPHIGHO2_02_FULL_52_10]
MGLNEIDILMAAVMAAVIFIGRKEGLIAGLFKLFGILCVSFVTLHYYVHFADFLRAKFFGEKTATEFFAFSLLAMPTILLFILISHGWVLILKVKMLAAIDRWSGMLLALVRSYFICGLLFVALVLSDHSYAAPRAMASVSRAIFAYAAVGFYERVYVSVIQKYFPNEKINEHPFGVVAQEPSRKKPKRR